MKQVNIFSILFLFFFLSGSDLFGQADDQVEIVQGEILTGEVKQGREVRKLKKSVIIRHKGSTLYCDSAYQYVNENTVDALGNAKLVNEDGSVVTSQNMFYDGNTRMAKAVKNVVLVDEGKTLYTEELDYDMGSKIAYYFTGGKIIDGESTLTSKKGTYDTNSKIFYFKENVVMINKDGSILETNDLKYNTVSKLAYFEGATKITTKDKAVLKSTSGVYNTQTKVSNFKGKPQVEDQKYILTGDSLYYDDENEIGVAIGNTELTSKEDSLIINGEISRFWGKEGISKVFGRSVMRQVSNSGKDTLYLMADTLISVNVKETNTKYMLAFHKVKIFRKDMQAICDSLVYNRADSMMYFYQDPVLWNKGNQMTADTIIAETDNRKLKKIRMRYNAFVIQTDTMKNFNQLKGRFIVAHFRENQIRKINVDGNSESIFFALEGDTIVKGMNKAECTDMVFQFKDNNKLKTITYINKPDALFIPPDELQEPQKRLKGFVWRNKERPVKESFWKRLRNEEEQEAEGNVKETEEKDFGKFFK